MDSFTNLLKGNEAESWSILVIILGLSPDLPCLLGCYRNTRLEKIAELIKVKFQVNLGPKTLDFSGAGRGIWFKK